MHDVDCVIAHVNHCASSGDIVPSFPIKEQGDSGKNRNFYFSAAKGYLFGSLLVMGYYSIRAYAPLLVNSVMKSVVKKYMG